MSKRQKSTSNERSSSRSSKRVLNVEFEIVNSLDQDCDEAVLIPNPNDSGDSNDDISEEEIEDKPNGSNNQHFQKSYRKIYDNYVENQKKMEEDHVYDWKDGEKAYSDELKHTLFLTDKEKIKISNSTPVELFEMFFCNIMKSHIIEATRENGYQLSMIMLNAFIGILIFSSFNKRKSQRDYWSSDPFLSSEVVSSTMSRNDFLNIKSKIKYSTPADSNPNDKGWRVRYLLEQFRKNIQQFGFFTSALSIDEMMIKSYARTTFKQFIKGKPIRFGIKMWALATADGFLLDLDLYCGKNSTVGSSILQKCALGTRVVLHLLKEFLFVTVPRKVSEYHIYFDNLFTSFDLVLHLKKRGLRSTGTIRDNRVKEKNNINKNVDRGTYAVKHDKNSGINLITIKDSKLVSIVSTAAGVTPLSDVKRYSADHASKVDLPFPNAFKTYNKFMGGVDLHDMHCNDLLPFIRSKKWTWVVFVRLIQSDITNALVIYNASKEGEKKASSKEFALSIAKHYMGEAMKLRKTAHSLIHKSKQKKCATENCPIRSRIFCEGCKVYCCKACSQKHVL